MAAFAQSCRSSRLFLFLASLDGIFSASMRIPFLRLHVPSQVVITLVMQDGLHAAGFLRRQQGRHDGHYILHDFESKDKTCELRQKDIVVGIRCCLHVASSSLKWGLSDWIEEPDVLDDCHMVLKSCRSSAEAMHRLISTHVVRTTIFEAAIDPKPVRTAFWRAMGVPESMVAWVMAVDPRWNTARKKLLVDPALEFEVGAYCRIEACVAYLLQFRRWSTTRWGGACLIQQAALFPIISNCHYIAISVCLKWLVLGCLPELAHLSSLASAHLLYLALSNLACHPCLLINVSLS